MCTQLPYLDNNCIFFGFFSAILACNMLFVVDENALLLRVYGLNSNNFLPLSSIFEYWVWNLPKLKNDLGFQLSCNWNIEQLFNRQTLENNLMSRSSMDKESPIELFIIYKQRLNSNFVLNYMLSLSKAMQITCNDERKIFKIMIKNILFLTPIFLDYSYQRIV